ncbi:MAG: SpoIIE family protein phosphatase [Bacillota bacterium]
MEEQEIAMDKGTPSYDLPQMPRYKNKTEDLYREIKKNLKDFKKYKKHAFIWRRDLLRLIAFMCFGYFWGQGEILGLFQPLGIAYISIFFGESIFFFTGLVSVMAGTLLENPLKMGALLTAAVAIEVTIGRTLLREERGKKALLAGFAMGLAGLFYAISQGGLRYFYVVAIVESAMAMVISYLAQKGMSIFFLADRMRESKDGQIWLPTKEEVLGGLFLISGVLVGMSGMDSVFVREGMLAFVCAYFIGISAKLEGMSGGATAGLVLGFLLYMCGGVSSATFALFGMAGLFAGAMRDLGRWAIALILVSVPLLMVFYQDRSAFTTLWLQGWAIGGLVFFLTPLRLMNLFQGQIFMQESVKSVYLKKKAMLEGKLLDFSKAFFTLAETFRPVEEGVQKNEIVAMVDTIAENTCNGCGLAHYCWEEDLYRSYSTTVNALSCCEEKGRVNLWDLPEDFRATCAKIDTYVSEINKAYEVYRRDRLWTGRLEECKKLVGQQMEAVGSLLEELSDEMDDESVFHEELAKEVKRFFNKKGIQLKGIQVIDESETGRRRVEFLVGSCGCKGDCHASYEMWLREIVGRPLQLKDRNRCYSKGDGMCPLTFLEIPTFQLTTATAVASSSQSHIGDATGFLVTEEGVAMMAVSDGMGKGEVAARESKTAIELLEQFSEAGFQKDISIKMINSALLLQRGEDSYATLDISAVDLFTGRAKFVKLGAVSSYILRGERILTVTAHTLPAGILEEVEVHEQEMNLKDGDIIIMMTDGVTEVIGSEASMAVWLKEKCMENPMANPEDIASYILKEVKKKNRFAEDGDDMTVMVGRFWKKRRGA